MSIIKYLRRLELKNSEVLQKEVKSSATAVTSRRDFFKKTAIYSAGALSAASVLTPISAKADDLAIINDAPWGQKLGDPVNKNLYGIPSPYEHNNIRRTHDLFSRISTLLTVQSLKKVGYGQTL